MPRKYVGKSGAVHYDFTEYEVWKFIEMIYCETAGRSRNIYRALLMQNLEDMKDEGDVLLSQGRAEVLAKGVLFAGIMSAEDGIPAEQVEEIFIEQYLEVGRERDARA